jgi:hypothetical protein
MTWSVGAATYAGEHIEQQQLLAQMGRALQYAQSTGRGIIRHIQQVPHQFEPSQKVGGMMTGELGPFDPAVLLQSISQSGHDGTLVLENEAGRRAVIVFANGLPIDAEVDKLKGLDALTEVIVTFENAAFRFNPKRAKDATFTRSSMPSIERCLLHAALAKDNLDAALKCYSLTDLFVPVHEDDLGANWKQLVADKDATPELLAACDVMAPHIDGIKRAQAVLSALDTLPTHVKACALALLVRYQMVVRADAMQAGPVA